MTPPPNRRDRFGWLPGTAPDAPRRNVIVVLLYAVGVTTALGLVTSLL